MLANIKLYLIQYLDNGGGVGLGYGSNGPPEIVQDHAILLFLVPFRLENHAFLRIFWVLAPTDIQVLSRR